MGIPGKSKTTTPSKMAGLILREIVTPQSFSGCGNRRATIEPSCGYGDNPVDWKMQRIVSPIDNRI